MKFIKQLFWVFFLITFSTYAQERTKEIGLITDNDLYTSSKNDMYYTNGLTLFYRFLHKNTNSNIRKKSSEITIGHYVYTPRYLNEAAADHNDRPYTGYLFGSYGQNRFYQNESVFKWNGQLGYVGPNSFAEEFQTNFHKTFNYKKVYGWENQIKNALAVQSHFLFSKKLFPSSTQKTIDLHFQSEANLGTIFTSVSTGFVSRIGFKKLTALFDSNFHGGSVGTAKYATSEFYFFLAPSIQYQLYDATIQGSLFNDNSPVTFDVKPIRFNGEAGFKYRKNNLNLSYSFIYRSKEIKDSPSIGFFYGSIGVSYLLL